MRRRRDPPPALEVFFGVALMLALGWLVGTGLGALWRVVAAGLAGG